MEKSMAKLSKMFDFHTCVILVVSLILAHSCIVQSGTENSLSQQYFNDHNHKLHRNRSQTKLEHRRHYELPLPTVELNANNSAPSIDDGDNAVVTNGESDNVQAKSAMTSSTSTPALHHKYYKNHRLDNLSNGQQSTVNSPSLPLLPSAAEERRTHQWSQPQEETSGSRFVPTPLPTQQSYLQSAAIQQFEHNSGGNQRRSSFAVINPLHNSKYSGYPDAIERGNYLLQGPPDGQVMQYPHRAMVPPEYKYDLHQHQQQAHKPEEDYYEDYNEDEDADVDADDDEDDTDGFVDDTDKHLSERSYARITRSKIDDDYADDEPYRNAVDDEMQRDAPPGVLTEHKYLELGNGKAVQQARERYIQEQKRPKTPNELATEHWQRMIHATKCRKPLPRVIPVSNNTSKRYEPYATILHRCGEDTGCCGSTASVCTVKRYEIVEVYVFSYDFNYRKEIEALPMHNHTECHCVNRASLQHGAVAPRGKRSGESWQHHGLQEQQQKFPSLQQGATTQTKRPHKAEHTGNMLSCHCPQHFSVFEEDVERYAHLPRPHTVFTRKCRCDCQSHNRTCLRFKNGEEGFSLEDRRCVMDHNCKPPMCSFGLYHIESGRCPPHRIYRKQKL